MEDSTTAKTKPKRRRWLLRLCIAGAVFLLAIILFCTLTSSDNNKTVWYTESEFAKAVKPGALTKLKNTVSKWRWFRPVLNRFQKPDVQISFQTILIKLQTDGVDALGLGTPTSTNFDGTHLWVLSAEQRDRLIWTINSSIPGISTRQEITSIDRRIWEFSAVPLTSRTGTVLAAGLVVDCLPHVYSDSIQLTLWAHGLKLMSNGLAGPEPIPTEFVVACRALIPNGGAAILDVHLTPPAFFIVAPNLINPDGTRIADNPKSSK